MVSRAVLGGDGARKRACPARNTEKRPMSRFIAIVLLSAFMPQLPLPGDRFPVAVMDMTGWKLTLPVDTSRPGRPDEIETTELRTFSDPRFFHVNANGDGVVFRVPCGGVTTKGSGYPRCELREMDGSGRVRASWRTDAAGIRQLSLRLAVTSVPPVKKHVVCTQIHDDHDDVLMVRLEDRKLFVERNRADDVSLEDTYVLGTPFNLRITSGGGFVDVWYNDVRKLRWRVSRSGCYFKVGCYTQSNTACGDLPESCGEVVIYSLRYTRP